MKKYFWNKLGPIGFGQRRYKERFAVVAVVLVGVVVVLKIVKD